MGNANTEPDSWHTASNWDANRVPGTGDHVCITSAANTDAIDFSTGASTSVASLESEEALTISAGTLQLTSATEESKVKNLTLSGSGILSGAGNLTIPAGGNVTWSGGEMRGTGRTLISEANGSSAAARLTISGTNTKGLHDNRVLENAGEVTMSGGFITSGNGASIKNTGIFDINGDSDIFFNGFTPKPHFENSGTLKKSSGTDITEISTSLDNTKGTVDVTSGTLNLTGGLANFSSAGGVGTLAGGTYMIRSNSVLKFIGADIDVNAATIVLDGLGSAILDQNNSDAIDNLSDNDGSFTIRADRDLRTIGALRNDGSVTIGTGSVLTTTGDYVQAAGSTALEDTTSKLAASGARVRVQDGVMKGLGTVEPALEATGGRVQPGLSSGILKVAGSYAPSSNGTLEIEIGGAAPGSGHDQLDVGTTASLGGTLDIVTPSSFTPTPGQSFTILKCGALDCRSGQFDNVQGTIVGSGQEYQVRYNATDVTLQLNTPPEANPDTAETDEDTPLNDIDVLSNDEDADGDILSVSDVTQPSNGSAEVVDGKVNYTPNADYNGPDSFSYTVSDGNGGTDTADVSITVNAVNDAPVVEDDSYTTDEDTTLNIDAPGVLENDTDADDGDSLSAVQVSGPAHGTLTLNDDGSFEYKPNENYFGDDEFTYKANDSNADSDVVTVSIKLNAVNDAPVAEDQSITTDEDTPKDVTLEASDVENANLTFEIVAAPEHGTLSGTGANLTYTPAEDYNGSDSFTFKANDGSLDSNVATVSITVNAVNDAPVAEDDIKTTSEDTALTFPSSDLVSNDNEGAPDEAAQDLTVTEVFDGTHGTVSLATDGNITFTPEANFNGAATFTYRVCDNGSPSECSIETATVNVTVNAVNDAPVAVDDTATTDEDTANDIAVITNDSDVDNTNAQLSVSSFTQPSHGQVTQNPDGTLKYTPTEHYNGSDSFTYNATDGTDDSNTATVSITVNSVNDAPVADDQSLTTDENAPQDITLGASDVENDILSYSVVAGPQHGTLSGTGANLTYTPNADYNGPDSFTFKVNDATDDSNTATVSITVNAITPPPVADDQEVTTEEDTPKDITLTANDVDGDSLTYSIVQGPTHGTLSGTGANLTYTPEADYNGPDSFAFKANDGNADSNVATVIITVTPVNDAPVAVDDTATTDEDTPVEILAADLFENDSTGPANESDQTLRISAVSGATDGSTAEINGAGNVLFTPATNFNGTASFNYTVCDDGTPEECYEGTATVLVTVSAVNDAPLAEDQSVTTDEDTAKDITLGATDVENDTLNYTRVSEPTHGTLSGTGANLTYEPAENYHGPDSFTFKANDGHLDSNVATVHITVTPVNDAPEAEGDSYDTNQNTALNVAVPGVLANDNDPDGDSFTAERVSDPSHGQLTLDANGSFTYNPALNYNGPDSFTYKANDGTDDSNVATVSITVKPLVDSTAPTVANVNPSGQAGVSTTTDITVTFSEKMDETTLNDNTVKLVKPGKKPTSIPVTMTKTTDGSGRTVLTLNPFGSAKQNLAGNTTYQLTIEGAGDGDTFAVKDLAGIELAQEAVSSFTTARK